MGAQYVVGVRIDGSAAGMARAAKEAQQAAKQMGTGMGQEFAKMAKAREQLGVRPEKEIQRELYKTEAAYNRLARSGTLSFGEQKRAAAAMREEVTRLTNEMGRLTTKQKLVRGAAIGGAAVAAGAVAHGVLAPKVRTAMDYDLRLAHMSNSAYVDRGANGRKEGRKELDRMIVDAVAYGRGTRAGALDAADALLTSGKFNFNQADTILKEAIKAATANNASSTDFAQIANASYQNMGIAPEQMKRVFGIGTYGGQSGGFEIANMAKHLPAQMAMSKAVGLYGEKGFAKLVALNQAAVDTAGTKDEAGNNVINLMAKLGSKDTTESFKKIGIDLPKQLAQGRMKGLDALDVLGDLLEGQLGKNKNYQQVQRELKGATNDKERSDALKAVGEIAQSTVISKVFADRQALMALLAYVNQRERVGKIAGESLANADTAVNKNAAVVFDTASSRTEQLANTQAAALQATMDKVLPAVGYLADGINGLMTKYPGYTTAIGAATVAVGALAGSAALAAAALRFGGGASTPGAPGAGGGKAGGGLGKFGAAVGGVASLLGPLGYLYTLDQDDIQRQLAYDKRRAGGITSGGGSGVRGQGFNDPRLIGGGQTGENARLLESLRTPLQGEIVVRVTSAPGLSTETTAQSNSPRIPLKALGQTNQFSGY